MDLGGQFPGSEEDLGPAGPVRPARRHVGRACRRPGGWRRSGAAALVQPWCSPCAGFASWCLESWSRGQGRGAAVEPEVAEWHRGQQGLPRLGQEGQCRPHKGFCCVFPPFYLMTTWMVSSMRPLF